MHSKIVKGAAAGEMAIAFGFGGAAVQADLHHPPAQTHIDAIALTHHVIAGATAAAQPASGYKPGPPFSPVDSRPLPAADIAHRKPL